MIGSLIYDDYLKLIKNNNININNFKLDQIKPSSIDLTLSEECYEIKYSFLSSNSKVRDRIDNLIIEKINLNKRYVFRKHKTYLVKLEEKLNLKDNIFGHCNPKSTTGRLDIFCRTIVDYSDEYEKIPKNYRGEIYLEITSRSFNIEFGKGDKLNQIRLVYNKHKYCNDNELKIYNNRNPIVFRSPSDKHVKIDSGVKVSVDLSNKNKINAYSAKKNAKIIKFNKVNFYKIRDFWELISVKDKSILIEKNKFYILKSKEKVKIPPSMAGEMVPYDTGIGDFRAHYAGFFDPGFGYPGGSFAVLEVKTSELPFLLQDGQTIARIKYEKLNKKSNIVYGTDIKSNYQNQELKLSKHFFEDE